VAKSSKATQADPVYMDPNRSPDERADDLLRSMTLEEKIHEMSSYAPWVSNRSWEQIILDSKGKFLVRKARQFFGKQGIG